MENPTPSTQDLAAQRTAMAGQRTLLANERTYAAWQRTGLVITTIGLAAAELLPQVNPQWLLQIVGIIFALLGGTIFALGFLTHYRMAQKLGSEASEGMPIWLLFLLTAALLLGSLATLIIIIL